MRIRKTKTIETYIYKNILYNIKRLAFLSLTHCCLSARNCIFKLSPLSEFS